jgi:hypothetical protein
LCLEIIKLIIEKKKKKGGMCITCVGDFWVFLLSFSSLGNRKKRGLFHTSLKGVFLPKYVFELILISMKSCKNHKHV